MPATQMLNGKGGLPRANLHFAQMQKNPSHVFFNLC